MKLTVIKTPDCSKCPMIIGKLEEVANKLWASLEIINAEDYKWEHLSEIVSVPTMIVEQELVDDTLYDYEWITNFIINNL